MKEVEIDVKKYINHQNQHLFDLLSIIYDIKLYLSPFQSSWCIENNTPNIRTPRDNGNIPSFTHELLHLFLDYMGMTSKIVIFENIMNIRVLGYFKRPLFDHLYNISSHKKMYPYFRDMGFKDVDFVKKTGSFFTQFDFTIIKTYKRLNILSKSYVSQFIGHTLSLMNDVVEVRRDKNRRFLHKLSKLDRDLYKVIYLFDSRWTRQVDLNCQDNFRELSNGILKYLISHNKINKEYKY
jgi:hypothetical protein